MTALFSFSVVILLLLIATAYAGEIDNKLLGPPVVDCQDTMVSLTFTTEKPFAGRIYVKGLADDNRCSRNFATNSDQNEFSMMIGQGDCNMGRQRVFGAGEPIEGLVFSLVIVVSFHGTFVTKSDRAFRCMCFFRNIKRVTNFIDMSMIGTTELLDTVKTPSCSYEIRSGSATGPVLKYATIGEKMYHTWSCDDPEQGFLVHSCWVNDGRGQRFDLLDIDGCAIDPIIQKDITYAEDLTGASVESHGYKFSDTSVLDYMCVLELCKKAAGECDALVPPQCGRGKRKRRDSMVVETKKPTFDQFGNTNEIDLLAAIQVLDTLEDDTSIAGPDQSFLNRLNHHQSAPTGFAPDIGINGSLNVQSVCVSYTAFGVLLAGVALLLVATTMALVLGCSRSSNAENVKMGYTS